MYVIFSKADKIYYDDVITGEIKQQTYETIPNEDYEVGVGAHLQVSSPHVVNARYSYSYTPVNNCCL